MSELPPENKVLKHFISSQLTKRFSRCFWPTQTCDAQAIKAHSIQNQRILEILAQDGHVIMPQMKMDFERGPRVELKKVGRNKATTFTGLCRKHDNLLFKTIDDNEVCISDSCHLFLLSYRSVLKGLHASMKAAVDVQSTYGEGVDLGRFDGSSSDLPMMLATEKIVSSWMFYRYKCLFDEAYLKQDWRVVEHQVINLETHGPVLAVSSVFSSGNYSQATQGPSFLVLNVFPQGSSTNVVFSHLKVHGPQVRHVYDRITSADCHLAKYELSKLVLKKCENFVMSPPAHNALLNDQVDVIIGYFARTILGDEDFDDPRLFLFGPVQR